MDLFELWAVLGLNVDDFLGGLGNAQNAIVRFLAWVGSISIDFGKSIFETGMGFDERMSAVQAVLGKEEGTLENMERLRAFGLEQAGQSIFTAEETAEAYYYMGMAGWKTEQMLAGLPGILNLAAASGEDLWRVSDIVTDSITAFGLTADDVNHYVDILAQTATNSNTDVKRMGDTFKYVAPIAGALGYSVDDVALSIGLLASAGIKGSMAGTTLRNIFMRISTNAGATKKDLGALEIVADKLGVSFYDSAGRARDWGDVLNELREAWQGLGGGEQREIVDSFNESIGSAEEAELTFKEFVNDLRDVENWTRRLNEANDEDEWNSYAQQIQDTAGQYDNLLKLLDIPIPNSIEGYADALDLAQAKLGKLSDEEKIYYAKQIGSMRGMSGLLALLQSTDDQVGKLVKSYDNAKDAAEAMAGVRLDNLAGDIKLFNAAYDVLKIAVHDDVKGPLRELVQDGTGAIQRITDAINKDGLTGGIEQFAQEIRDFSKRPGVEAGLQAIGSLLGELFTGAVTTLTPALSNAAITMGRNFASGLLEGLTQGVKDQLGYHSIGPLGQGIRIWDWLFGENKYGLTATPTYEQDGAKSNIIKFVPSVKASDLEDALATAAVGSKIEIDGFTFDANAASTLLNEVKTKYPDYRESGVTIGDALGDGVVDSVSSASIIAAQNLFSTMTDTDTAISEDLANDLSSVGPDVGANLASDIGSALSNTRFSIGVQATVYGLPSGGGGGKWVMQTRASAMNMGHIYKRATVFGYDDGIPQVAGDAGAEAVVGVNSLYRMIQNAVNQAIGSVEIDVPRKRKETPIILEMNGREVGRGVLPYIESEQRRIGVKLATGGAY